MSLRSESNVPSAAEPKTPNRRTRWLRQRRCSALPLVPMIEIIRHAIQTSFPAIKPDGSDR